MVRCGASDSMSARLLGLLTPLRLTRGPGAAPVTRTSGQRHWRNLMACYGPSTGLQVVLAAGRGGWACLGLDGGDGCAAAPQPESGLIVVWRLSSH